MRKKFVGATLDAESLRLLQIMAERENEGNMSRQTRDIIRQAAKKRGITVDDGKENKAA